MVSHPAFDTADQAQSAATVTTIRPGPPVASTATDVGETEGVQAGGEAGGVGFETGGCAGGTVGSGGFATGVSDAGGTGAAGWVPVWTIVTEVPLIDTVAIRGSLPGFDAAVATTAPAPCPSAGVTCSQGALAFALQRQSRAAVIVRLTRSPFEESACCGVAAVTEQSTAPGPVICETDVDPHDAAETASVKTRTHRTSTTRRPAYVSPGAPSGGLAPPCSVV